MQLDLLKLSIPRELPKHNGEFKDVSFILEIKNNQGEGNSQVPAHRCPELCIASGMKRIVCISQYRLARIFS